MVLQTGYIAPSSIRLTDEQSKAANLAKNHIARNQDCVIHGLAGTGKSVTLAYLANELDAHVVAPTGKAALVVAQKTGRAATTIHGLFYRLVDHDIDKKTQKLQPVFEFRPKVSSGDVVLIDECSMVDATKRREISETGACIVAFGDPGQLPPVNAESGFPKPDYLLKEIHRQAADSPILQQAYQVRNGKRYNDLGIAGFSIKKEVKPEDLLEADIVLCWKNKTVAMFNEAIREIKGFKGKHAQRGELVMCLRNWHSYGIMNGGIYECCDSYSPKQKTIGVIVDGVEVLIPSCEWRTNSFNDPIKTAFDYAYCATVHKSQGSEWHNVLLIDEFKGEDRNRWLYTGFTRAAKNLSVYPMF